MPPSSRRWTPAGSPVGVAAKRNDLTAAIGKIATALACDARNTQPGCGVTFRYIVQVNRNN
jgi:hypothetical protein